MKNSQKGFITPLLLAIIAVLLIGGGAYVYIQQKPANHPVTGNSTTQTADWKSYQNTRYGYTIKYPTNWFIDTTYSESDFTQRGPAKDNNFIGGDTTWSNYVSQNPRDYPLEVLPSDIARVNLMIWKSDIQTTIDNFIILKHQAFIKKEYLNINGVSGVRLTSEDPNNPSVTSETVLLKVGDKVFDFSGGRNSSSTIMNEILSTFKLQ